jgi:hypothetical protein
MGDKDTVDLESLRQFNKNLGISSDDEHESSQDHVEIQEQPAQQDSSDQLDNAHAGMVDEPGDAEADYRKSYLAPFSTHYESEAAMTKMGLLNEALKFNLEYQEILKCELHKIYAILGQESNEGAEGISNTESKEVRVNPCGRPYFQVGKDRPEDNAETREKLLSFSRDLAAVGTCLCVPVCVCVCVCMYVCV